MVVVVFIFVTFLITLVTLSKTNSFGTFLTFCQKPLSASSDLLELVDDQSVEGGEREDRQEPEGRNLVFMLGAGEL